METATIDIFAHWHAGADTRIAWDTQVVERAVMARFANGWPLVNFEILTRTMGFLKCDGSHCDYHDKVHGCYDPLWDRGNCDGEWPTLEAVDGDGVVVAALDFACESSIIDQVDA